MAAALLNWASLRFLTLPRKRMQRATGTAPFTAPHCCISIAFHGDGQIYRVWGGYTWGPSMRAAIHLWHAWFLLETPARETRAEPTSQGARKALCRWHPPVGLAPCSGSDNTREQGLGTACGNGSQVIAPLQKTWNCCFRVPALALLWLGGHRDVVRSGQQFPHVLNVFKIFNVSIWIFLGGLIVQI